MINDKDIQYNMALYMGLMERKYQTVKQKRKQLEMIIFQAAARIQRSFKRYLMKRNTRYSIKIQRWWRKQLRRYRDRNLKIYKFKVFFYGLIVTRFLASKLKNKKIGQRYSKQKTKLQTKSYLTRITYYFPDYICRKSALHAEIKYINKYRQYLRQNFESEWQKYEVKLTKELWKQIGRKWVKVDSKQKKQKKVYLTDQDKQIDGQQYICNKLNKMYEQQHSKMDATDTKLKNNQNELMLAIQRVSMRYKQKILSLD